MNSYGFQADFSNLKNGKQVSVGRTDKYQNALILLSVTTRIICQTCINLITCYLPQWSNRLEFPTIVGYKLIIRTSRFLPFVKGGVYLTLILLYGQQPLVLTSTSRYTQNLIHMVTKLSKITFSLWRSNHCRCPLNCDYLPRVQEVTSSVRDSYLRQWPNLVVILIKSLDYVLCA